MSSNIAATEKLCRKCGNVMSVELFVVQKSKSSGHGSWCKKCFNKYSKEWRLKDPDRYASLLEKQRKYHKDNKEKTRPYRVAYGKKYRECHREEAREQSRLWRVNNPGRLKDRVQKWRAEHPERVRILCRAATERWRARNIEVSREKHRIRQRAVCATPRGNINARISASIWHSIKRKKGGRSWEGLLGYDLNRLMRHLEKRFLPGMTWENMGEWHIDHKIPISAFNFQTAEDVDFKRCWALKNLQPLWKVDNLIKNAKLSRPFQPSLLLEATA